MKKIVLILFILLFSTYVNSIEITDATSLTPDQTTATISSIQQDVKQIQIKMGDIPSKADIDSSFQQLDAKVSSANQNSAFSSLAFFIGAMVLNDILIFGLFIFGKVSKVIP